MHRGNNKIQMHAWRNNDTGDWTTGARAYAPVCHNKGECARRRTPLECKWRRRHFNEHHIFIIMSDRGGRTVHVRACDGRQRLYASRYRQTVRRADRIFSHLLNLSFVARRHPCSLFKRRQQQQRKTCCVCIRLFTRAHAHTHTHVFRRNFNTRWFAKYGIPLPSHLKKTRTKIDVLVTVNEIFGVTCSNEWMTEAISTVTRSNWSGMLFSGIP